MVEVAPGDGKGPAEFNLVHDIPPKTTLLLQRFMSEDRAAARKSHPAHSSSQGYVSQY